MTPFAPTGRAAHKAAFLVALLALGLSVVGCSQRESSKPLFDYRVTTLDNGLQVVTVEDFSCPIVTVHVTYRVGSKDERADRNGFAHMVEHMMFYTTETLGPEELTKLVRQSGGNDNGYTNFDRTAYMETVPAYQLPLALWLEAERMAFLKVNQGAFDTERKVVEEERRMDLNQPYGSVLEKLLPEVFKVHPYRWERIGNIAHLRASSAAEARGFWGTYYVPSNATLVIVGAVKHADALEQAREYLGWIPKYPAPPAVAVREPQPTAARTVDIRERNAPAPLAVAVYRTVPAGDDDAVAVQMLARVLAGGHASRLYRELVADKQLAAKVEMSIEPRQQDGILELYVTLQPEGDIDAALAAIRQQVEKLRSQKLTARELMQVKNQMLKDAVTATLTTEGKADVLADAAVLEGDIARANEVLARIRKLTEDDLLRVAGKYLAPERALWGRVAPSALGKPTTQEASEEDAPITALGEGKVPPPGRPGAKRPAWYPTTAPVAGIAPVDLRIDHTACTLDNGMKLIVVPNSGRPYVSVFLGLEHGEESAAKCGASKLAMDMLTKGAAGADEARLSEELATYAIDLHAQSGMDSAGVTADCLSEHLDRAMDLLGQVVLTPTFPNEEFEKLRRRFRTELEVNEASPDVVADREFARRLWGEHPYSRASGIRLKDLDALKLEDLTGWYRTFARPDAATLIISGDVTPARARQLAGKVFGQWRAKGPSPQVKLPDVPAPSPTRLYLVDRPGLEQSEIRVGQPGITRRHPDYLTTPMVNGYFGGDLDSRLYQKLRVQTGLTYGISGRYAAYRQAGTFQVSTFTKTETTAVALREVLKEIRRLRDEPPTGEEMAVNRAYVLGSFPASRETPQAQAADLWLIESMALPADFFSRYVERVAKTTPDDCTRLVRQTVDPDKLVIVVVGDAEKVKQDLEKIAPVTVVKE